MSTDWEAAEDRLLEQILEIESRPYIDRHAQMSLDSAYILLKKIQERT